MRALPDESRLLRAMDATWAPAEMRRLGPWTLRRGLGGGKRVSAATSDSPVTDANIDTAEAEMRAMGQVETFMLRKSADALDRQLAARGYRLVDPVLLFAAPIEALAAIEAAPLDAIASDAPLAMMEEVWAEGGFGPARIDVMRRTKGPKAHMFSRFSDAPAGCAFVALDGDVAMLHALAVRAPFRREGVARRIMGRAAVWAQENGATSLALATTSENRPAQGLFSGIGMHILGHYHYRMR